MNVKALMFGVLGMLIFGSITIAWISKDMSEIRAEERADLTKECKEATPAAPAADAAAAAPGATPATAAAAPAADVSEDLVKRCNKIGITLTPAAAPVGEGAGVAPLNSVPTAPTTPLAPLATTDAPGTADAPIAGGDGGATAQPKGEAANAHTRQSTTTKQTADAVPTDAGTAGLPPRIGRTSSISMADPRE